MRYLPILLSIAALSACASTTEAVNKNVTPAKIQADTARYFSTSPRNVTISNVRQTMLGTNYRARVGRTNYTCSQFRSAVSCDRAAQI